MLEFNASIYMVGINALVDVPAAITSKLRSEKGYIWIRGMINGFPFAANLVPTKDGLHRLYVNLPMLKGGGTKPGETANFTMEQNPEKEEVNYPMHPLLAKALKKAGLREGFDALSGSGRKNVLKYLHYLKTDASRERNIDKLIGQLQRKEKDIRIP